LVDVLADGAATVEELEAGPAAARVAFVLVAAVAVFLAAEDAVPAVAVEAFPAALARVIRLGGDAGGSMVTGSWKLEAGSWTSLGGNRIGLVRIYYTQSRNVEHKAHGTDSKCNAQKKVQMML
jgi:hypothetical protein